MTDDVEHVSHDTSLDESSRSSGRVKWFNNRQGYGFLTSKDGEDIFVHHTALTTDEQQYRYLVQGEYVEFGKTQADSGDHKWQAVNVRGVGGGKLMCETRNEARGEARTEGRGGDKEGRSGEDGGSRWEGRENRSRRKHWNEDGDSRPPLRVRGGGPREYDDDDGGVEWKLVPVRRNASRNQGGRRRGPRPRHDEA